MEDTEKLQSSVLDEEVEEIKVPRRPQKISTCLAIAVAMVCICYPFAIGSMNGLAVGNVENLDWYKHVNKAPWTPPGWVFGVVWTALYLMMGTASFLLWLNHVKRGVEITLPALMYAVQLLLNGFWIPLAFGNAYWKLALADLLLLFTAVMSCIFQFWRISRTAAVLMMPYALWLIVAISLNTYLALYNRDGKYPQLPTPFFDQSNDN